MATIRLTKEGGWQAIIRKKNVSTSRVFKLKSDANRWAIQTESEIERGVFVNRSELESTLFRDVCDSYAKNVLPKLKGEKSDRGRLSRLVEDLGKYNLAQLNGVVLAKFRTELELTYAPMTVIHFLSLVSRVLKYAMVDLDMPSIVIPRVKKPKVPQGRDRRVSDDELALLINSSGSPELKIIIQLAVETAMRRSEIISLRWSQISYPLIKLDDTKNGDKRIVPLSQKAVALLKSMPVRIDGKVFGMRSDSVTQAFERARNRVGLDDVHFHDLRHEATSRLATKVPNIIELAAITGHKDVQMLKRYYHVDPLELAKKLG